MEAEGQLVDSLALLEQLSGKSSYYGFLAADKLRRAYHIEQENASSVEVDEDEFLAANPHMLRARELYFLDRLIDAKREWFQALRYLDQDQIKQAATLASKWKWHDSAIRTVAKTPHRADYNLRFPTPYKPQVMAMAQKKELDPALIYGVMRRESLFDPLARSSVERRVAGSGHRAEGSQFARPETAAQVGYFENREQYSFRHALFEDGDEPIRQ